MIVVPKNHIACGNTHDMFANLCISKETVNVNPFHLRIDVEDAPESAYS